MADYPASSSSSPATTAGNPPVTATLLAYALFGVAAVVAIISHGLPTAAPLMGLVGIAGVIVAYVKRDEAQGSWVASHLRWLIRTFWYSLLWGVVGAIVFVLFFIVLLLGPLLAVAIWSATSVWVLYRVIRGYLLFKDNKPVPGM